MKAWLLTILIMSLLFVGTKPAFAHIETAQREALISIGNKGYNPSTIALLQGVILIFRNDSSKPRWPYLTTVFFHSLSPVAPIPPGAQWEIRPMTLGTWQMKDHELPNFSGALLVQQNDYISKYMVVTNPKIPTGENIFDFFFNTWKNLYDFIFHIHPTPIPDPGNRT